MKKAGRQSGLPMPGSAEESEPRTPEEWLRVYRNECPGLYAADCAAGVYINVINGMNYFTANPDILFADRQSVSPYPEYFQGRKFEMFSVKLYSEQAQSVAGKILARCQNYVEKFDRIVNDNGGIGIYFSSKTRGSGKTFLSTIIGAELTRKGKRVIWFSMPDLLQQIKSTYDRESGVSTSREIARLQNAEVLLLDDIGAEKQSAWVEETIYSILDRRMQQCRPTIFTSNLRPDELKYDDRIKDRIKRMVVEFQMPEEAVRKRLSRYSEQDLLRLLDE